MIEYFDGIHTRSVSTPGCRCGWTGEDYEAETLIDNAEAEARDELAEHRLVCDLPDVRLAEEERLDRLEMAREYTAQIASGAPRLTEPTDRVTPDGGALSSAMGPTTTPVAETPAPVSEPVGEIAARTQGAL